MGTNYYLIRETCPHCHSEERLHIGKSSAGWDFTLRVHEDGPKNLEDWIRRFLANGVKIFDEYGKEVSVQDMLKVILVRGYPEGDSRREAPVSENNSFERNPVTGLCRTRIGVYSCVGHGSSYELNTGEFS